ncbi:MAG: amino acid ABC transporter permease [Desulfobacterales bacterium]
MADLSFYTQELTPALWRGLKVSIALILPSALFGLAIGVLAGTLRVYGRPFWRRAAELYGLVFRGFPLMVQLYLWYFGLPQLGIYLSPYAAAVIGFSLCGGAYHAEYVRGALRSIKQGQLQAARALGFSRTRAVWSILLPQAIRRAIPGCGNELIYLIKYSSLAYTITCIELTGEAKILASLFFKYLEVFFVVGAVYLLLVSLASWGLSRLEQAVSLPGFEYGRR